jgi:hypothetical protein
VGPVELVAREVQEDDDLGRGLPEHRRHVQLVRLEHGGRARAVVERAEDARSHVGAGRVRGHLAAEGRGDEPGRRRLAVGAGDEDGAAPAGEGAQRVRRDRESDAAAHDRAGAAAEAAGEPAGETAGPEGGVETDLGEALGVTGR